MLPYVVKRICADAAMPRVATRHDTHSRGAMPCRHEFARHFIYALPPAPPARYAYACYATTYATMPFTRAFVHITRARADAYATRMSLRMKDFHTPLLARHMKRREERLALHERERGARLMMLHYYDDMMSATCALLLRFIAI